ncbi:hypothetical protein [Streptosporangium carneum]|uniref:Uncharacterized protein n=1 Tax=Streptosporangium carneum TaxID=47481 RepID=A0A9W6MGF1_9ACTN|nr:hypothetical protein [Streptosporangium carneum]GLK13166.1 hypothetical protein GCM10017600_65770 [Streptosporangium carneum]
MTTDLEKSLAAEFTRAAEHAPKAADDLRARIEAGHRHRRRRGVALYAAAAVVVMSTGGTFAVDALSAHEPAVAIRPTATALPTASPTPSVKKPAKKPTPKPPASPPAPDRSFPPIEKVWPDAVHTVPAALPDGRPFHPELFLDDHTVLARTEQGGNPDRMDGLWAYDITSRTARRLVAVTPPPRTVVTASFVSAGGGQLAWWTVRKQQNKLIVDIWTAPSSGGAQRRVTSFEGVPRYGGIDLAIVGGKAVWSLWGRGGVHQVSLSGGRPEQLPGSAKHTLIGWPWAASPGLSLNRTGDAVTFGDLLDLRTGESSQATARKGSTCLITWCLRGSTATRRDGTGRRELPGFPDGGVATAPALDRFLTLVQRGKGGRLRGQVLYDLATGRAADLGLRTDGGSQPSAASLDYRAPGLFAYQRGGKQVIVNLSRIR